MQDVFRANIAENSIYSTLRKIARDLVVARGGLALVKIEVWRECFHATLEARTTPVHGCPTSCGST